MTCPTRVQRKRIKGWKMPENTVYVGRPTKFGNPFDYRLPIAGRQAYAREDAVALYRDFLARHRGPTAPTDADIASLRGKNLACWCPWGEPCHVDVLLELANTPSPLCSND
jgi:hypothetical protein